MACLGFPVRVGIYAAGKIFIFPKPIFFVSLTENTSHLNYCPSLKFALSLFVSQGERTKFDRFVDLNVRVAIFESTNLSYLSSFFDLKYTEYAHVFQDLI